MIVDIWNRLTSVFSRTPPEAVILLSFASAIIIGMLLLLMPYSHNGDVGFMEALFTATSAVCVTGLIVVDTGTDFTFLGQAIILILIQIGGLGIMTFAALAFDLLGKKLSLNSQEAMASELVHEELSSILHSQFKRMLLFVFTIECIGALFLIFAFLPGADLPFALWSSLFHSISAFCNAGFSLYPDSLMGFSDNHLTVHIIAILIITGGIGYPVFFNLMNSFKEHVDNGIPYWNKLSPHSKITLVTTFLLIVFGTICLMCSEGLTNGSVLAAYFQSITARTAGFNTVDIGNMALTSLLILIILMFIGGSPGSCAGGIKTTTFAIWINQLWNRLRGRNSTIFYGRYIADPLVRRSSTIISLAILFNFLGVYILSITEKSLLHKELHKILFEQISAFATVGLSTGITPDLSQMGQFWIIFTMFIGRTGTITSVLLLLRERPIDIKYPEGKVMIG